MSLRVIVIDDDDFTRMGVVTALQASGVHISGSCATSAEALKIQRTTSVDAAVVDLDLGQGPSGLDLARGLRRANPAIGIVFLTHLDDPRLLLSPSEKPPLGAQYVVKRSVADPHVLLDALDKATGALSQPGVWPKGVGPLGRLTTHQLTVLHLLAQGLSNREIAQRHSVSEKSVEKTISRLAKRLGIPESLETNQRVGLAQTYYQHRGG